MGKALLIRATALAALTAAGPDVTVLSVQAARLLHMQPTYRKAVLLEADGTPARHRLVKTAGGIVKWRFVFDNQASASTYKSATVTAVRGRFGKVYGHTQPFLDDQAIRPIPTMTLAQAIQHLSHAGYTKGFWAVTLRKPLAYPPVKHTEYIFTVAGGRYIAVDTQTGRVAKIS